MNQDNPNKLYYSIGEVADMFDVNTSLIRFWEKKFDCIKPKKNNKGNRLFTQNDIELFRIIWHLVKEKGMTLSGAQKRIKNNLPETERNYELTCKLKTIRQMLIDIRNEI